MTKQLKFLLLMVLFVSIIQGCSTGSGDTDINNQFSLNLSRDFGYGGFNNDIQGLFSMHVTASQSLEKVEFYIDEVMVFEDKEAPYSFQFNTDEYSFGIHTLYAIGLHGDQPQLRTNEIQANFVSPSQGTATVGNIILPTFGIVLIAIVLSVLVPMLDRKKLVTMELGTERKYGLRGGTICNKCRRPFVLPIFSVHLGFSKLARCPFCGKVGLVRIQTKETLREAERAELLLIEGNSPVVETNEDRLKKDLDESKYQ